MEFDCNSMLAAPMNTLIGQEVEQQQLIRMIEEAYSISKDQLEVRNFRDYEFWTGGDVWDVQWHKLGVNYEVSVEDNITYRIDVHYQEQSAPSAKRIVECLGEMPQYYVAVYQVEVPPDAPHYYSAFVNLLFAGKGIGTSSYEARHQHFTPIMSEDTSIGRLTYVKPGSSLQVYNRSIGYPDDAESMFELQPWPGSWDELKFVDTTAE